MIETPDRLLPIEIKASNRVTTSDARVLETFLDEYHDLTDGALILYTGDDTFPITRRVQVTPWWKVI